MTGIQTLDNLYIMKEIDSQHLGSYGHNFKVPTIDELINCDDVVICDGVRGRSDGALYVRFKYNRYGFYEEIPNSINIGR